MDAGFLRLIIAIIGVVIVTRRGRQVLATVRSAQAEGSGVWRALSGIRAEAAVFGGGVGILLAVVAGGVSVLAGGPNWFLWVSVGVAVTCGLIAAVAEVVLTARNE